jgi:hypothetical protein
MRGASFPSDEPSRRRRPVLLFLLVFLALSLLGLRKDHEGWQAADSEFELSAQRWQIGLPTPWLRWTALDSTGVAPPIESLPDGREYLPGVHCAPFALAIALLCAAALGWILAAFWRRLHGMLARRDALAQPRALALFFAFGTAFGALTHWVELGWWGVVFLLLPLPALVAWSCGSRPNIWLAAAHLFGWILGFELVLLLEEGRPWVDRAFDPKQDLGLVVAFLLGLAPTAALLALIRRRRGRPAATAG